MVELWMSLNLAQQIFACIAVPATLLLIIQIVMMLIGAGHDTDGDFDTDTDTDGGIGDTDADTGDSDFPDAGLSFFTFRGIVAMLSITGWSGVVFTSYTLGLPLAVGIAIAVAFGAATLVGVAFLMRAVYSLQYSGNLDVSNAIGKVAQVYIPIPAGGKSSGKVNLTVQEQLTEFTAITTSDETLKTGSFVRVVAVSESGVLVVEPVTKNK